MTNTQRYGKFDKDGFPMGFYSDQDHTPEEIPQDAMSISHDQWTDFLNNQGERAYRNGEVVPATRPPEPLPPPDQRVERWVQGDPVTHAFIDVVADLTGTTAETIKSSIAQKIAAAQ
jgi:hypothetical protein